ncbi:MAG: hypothetical protein IID41_00735 [Planctomycetes bacterium]|nr:hypothetical protein [Planctomycetota bacterium]
MTTAMEEFPLQTELRHFDAHRKEWTEHHQGKFALIKGEDMAGVFDSWDNAYEAGVSTWGNVAFLVKQILPEDPVESAPALTYGLINAHFE